MTGLRCQRKSSLRRQLSQEPTSCVIQALVCPATLRLAAGTAALKDASRRASARWPRKNEAILDRGDPRCLGMFRPGRENGTRPNQKTSIVVIGWRTLQQPPTEAANMCLLPTTSAACDDQRLGGRIQVCLVFVSQGWGSVHAVEDHLRSSAFHRRSSAVEILLWPQRPPRKTEPRMNADERRLVRAVHIVLPRNRAPRHL
jgi:hypothetical protein